jgi:hypothetical protein
MSYPTNLVVEYTNTAEYRKCLRQLFQMKTENFIINNNTYDEPLDEESADELSYDEESTGKVMDFIYAKTKDSPLFQEVYDLAAGFMFSTDRNIGLTVLFSYDYLKEFHGCLVAYLTGSPFVSDTPIYKALLIKLGSPQK